MRGRGGWGEPKAPTPDLGPRASFPHWPWAAPAPHLKGKRVGDRKVQPFCLGGGFTGLPAWPWGTSPTAQEPAARRASCPIAWVPVAGGHSRRSRQALGCAARAPGLWFPSSASPGSRGHAPPPTAAHGSPRQPTAVSGKGPEEARAPRPVCARGRELRYGLRNREASEAGGDRAPREGGGQAFCSYPESGPGCQGSFWG